MQRKIYHDGDFVGYEDVPEPAAETVVPPGEEESILQHVESEIHDLFSHMEHPNG